QIGLAFGRNSVGGDLTGLSVGVQGRLGVRYSKPDVRPDSAVWSLDGAIGFGARRVITSAQSMSASAGLEFRYGNRSNDIAERVQTDYLLIRGALEVPLIGGTSVSLGFTQPLVGKSTPSLSINFNWGLLLSSVGSSAGVP